MTLSPRAGDDFGTLFRPKVYSAMDARVAAPAGIQIAPLVAEAGGFPPARVQGFHHRARGEKRRDIADGKDFGEFGGFGRLRWIGLCPESGIRLVEDNIFAREFLCFDGNFPYEVKTARFSVQSFESRGKAQGRGGGGGFNRHGKEKAIQEFLPL